MTAQHTPGPWKCSQYLGHPAWSAGIDLEQRLANARLIAAAPDLLAALNEADEDFAREGFDKDGPYRAHIIAAIAKATGGAA